MNEGFTIPVGAGFKPNEWDVIKVASKGEEKHQVYFPKKHDLNCDFTMTLYPYQMINVQPFIDQLNELKEFLFCKIDGN